MKSTELKIDVLARKGDGGFSQHVPTGIRITHLPTDTEVYYDSEHSQHANKEKCIQMLEALFGPLEVITETPEQHLKRAAQAILEFMRSPRNPNVVIKTPLLQVPLSLLQDLTTALERCK